MCLDSVALIKYTDYLCTVYLSITVEDKNSKTRFILQKDFHKICVEKARVQNNITLDPKAGKTVSKFLLQTAF